MLHKQAKEPTTFQALVAANRAAGRLAAPEPEQAAKPKAAPRRKYAPRGEERDQIAMRLPPEEARQIKEIAQAQERSVAWMARSIFLRGLQATWQSSSTDPPTATSRQPAAMPIEPTRRTPRTSHLGRRLRFEGTRLPCPHCDAACEIRTSRMLSSTMRESIYACTNVECGHTFVATLEIVRTLSPSATPRASVRLPLSSHVQRAMLRAVLDCAGSAEHQALFVPPATADMFDTS